MSSLFRQEAVQKMSSPDQLDTMLTVTRSRSWLGLVALGLILAAFLVWGFTGTINTEVTGEGVLLRPGGISREVSPVEGQVESIKVAPGDRVKEGQAVAVLESQEHGEYTVYSRRSGRVLEVFVRVGEMADAGTRLFSLEVGGDTEEALQAILYVPMEDGQLVQPGMEVKIATTGFSPVKYGYLLGRVITVADYPSTFEGLLSVLGNEELAARLMGVGLPMQVQVVLIRDDTTPSGYQWTTGQGPDTLISSGQLCQGAIIIQQEPPINLLIPGFNRE